MQRVRVEPDVWVANMVAQHDYRTAGDPVPSRYDALEAWLTTVGELAVHLAAGGHLPRIGGGLAGGTRAAIATVLDRTPDARGITTTVYDLAQPPR